MFLLRKTLTCDYIYKNNYILIFDHENFRIIKLKNKYSIIKIFKCIDNGGITRRKLYHLLEERNLSLNKFNKIINGMIEIGVIVEDYFPDRIDLVEGRGPKIKELEYDNRFGLEIAAFRRYETGTIDRFEIFRMIQKTMITIIGVGGIGANLAVMLAAFGIGKIKLIDGDVVEKSNLVRQIFYKEADCGKSKKVVALKKYINEFTTHTQVECCDTYIDNEKDAQCLLKDEDLVIQTADRPKVKIDHIINKICVKKGIPVLFTHNQSVGPFYIPGMSICYACFAFQINQESNGLFDEIVNSIPDDMDSIYPSLVTGPWILAYHIFNEIVRFIIPDKAPRSLNSLLLYRDGIASRQIYKKLSDCDKCCILEKEIT